MTRMIRSTSYMCSSSLPWAFVPWFRKIISTITLLTKTRCKWDMKTNYVDEKTILGQRVVRLCDCKRSEGWILPHLWQGISGHLPSGHLWLILLWGDGYVPEPCDMQPRGPWRSEGHRFLVCVCVGICGFNILHVHYIVLLQESNHNVEVY
jgi:hypothetical protein